MAEATPVARGPIAPVPPEVVTAGWAVSGHRSTAALTITDCAPLTKVAVRAPWDGAMARRLGVRFGRAARLVLAGPERVLVTGSGPGEWLVLGAPGRHRSIIDRLLAYAAPTEELVTVTDLTHARALVRITGGRSADLLATECGVDLGDDICPDGAALRSTVAGLAAEVVRDDRDVPDPRDAVRSYLVHCERSSGQYLFDSLLDSGAELGLDTDGFVPPGI